MATVWQQEWIVMDGGVERTAQKLSAAQRKWLERGLTQPGGKLPLFDADGRKVNPAVIRKCLDQGWAEPWFANQMKPDWLVCKLTTAGRSALAETDASHI
jgi:hypothetical protein